MTSAISEQKTLIFSEAKSPAAIPSKEKSSCFCFIKCLTTIFKACCFKRPTQAAAITLQRYYRGHVDRVIYNREKRHYLSYARFKQAIFYVDHRSERLKLPTADAGITAVYFLNDVVLKESGLVSSPLRFEKMKRARNVCEENGYTHLVIPTARVYKDCIIEKRLPIDPHYLFLKYIQFYTQHQDLFDQAAREFTGFLCQTTLFDLSNIYSFLPFKTLSDQPPRGRYDNVALYLDEAGVARVGLLDLQYFEPICNRTDPLWCVFKCYEIICLFPYHLEVILEEATKFDPDIGRYRVELEDLRDAVLAGFK